MRRCVGCGHDEHIGIVCDVEVQCYMSTMKCGCKFERNVEVGEGVYSFTETLGEYSQKVTFKTLDELNYFIQKVWKQIN